MFEIKTTKNLLQLHLKTQKTNQNAIYKFIISDKIK